MIKSGHFVYYAYTAMQTHNRNFWSFYVIDCEFWLTVAGWADGEVLADQPRETGTGAEGKGVPEAVIWICLFDGQL